MKKRIFIIILCVLMLVVAGFLFNKFFMTGKAVVSNSSGGAKIQIYPLSSAEKKKVVDVIGSNSLLKDMPKDGVVSLRFFNFKNGERIWQDGFLIGKEGILKKGKPDISLILHSKYLSELSENNFCEVIQKANKNGDLGFISSKSNARLLWKYRGMIKNRKCFGF